MSSAFIIYTISSGASQKNFSEREKSTQRTVRESSKLVWFSKEFVFFLIFRKFFLQKFQNGILLIFPFLHLFCWLPPYPIVTH